MVLPFPFLVAPSWPFFVVPCWPFLVVPCWPRSLLSFISLLSFSVFFLSCNYICSI
ncbi:uncharacterized protein F5147DRAFT_417443 [Suillus discolor]|uniref:Uncharacterized protein n=1 Tax=Suillus discolor TaxID=1912936 RepID=A0A9P7EXD0_9AGAM|nr:uncharacterized protein F5147DRAFT_417443 [Suillus discolor]KAG2094258.1 hypothetical protein F5147DRAFT_417443 [Suillus discolor]